MTSFFSKKYLGLKPYVPGEQPQDTVYVKLNTNENPFPPSENVTLALNRFNTQNLKLYPDPENTVLQKAYADYLNVNSENVFVTNGSDEALAFIFQAFFDENNGVAFADITYGFYPVYAQLFNAKTEIIPLKDDYSIDIEAFCSTENGIVLANPNAPTGIALSLYDVEKIVASKKNRLVVIDEAYVDFGGESAVSLVNKYDNLIVVHTFSKSRSLAGLRVGFVIANEALIADVKAIKYSFNSYNVDRLAEILGTAAINDNVYFRSVCKKVIENRMYLTEKLIKIGFSVLPSTANFVWASHQKISGEKIYRELKKRGILVRYFDKDRLRDGVRITIGSFEQIETLIEKIIEITEEI